MYFSSLYHRGVRSSLTKTCCLPSIFLRSFLLERNSFHFCWKETHFVTRFLSWWSTLCHPKNIIILEIDFKLICYFEQDFFLIIVVFFIFFFSINKNIFSCTVLVCQVEKQSDLFPEPSHCIAVLFLQADSTYFLFLYSIQFVFKVLCDIS